MNSKYEWDLTTIFKTQEDFEKAIDELYKEINKIKNFKENYVKEKM